MVRSIHEIPIFENIPILVRAPLNEPVQNGVVVDTFRLQRTVQTLRFLADRGAKVIVISHIGGEGTETLAPIAEALKQFITNVSFFPETIGVRVRSAIRDLAPGHIIVLENLRRHTGEKNNDLAFAKELASLADVFVEDSFDTCHRKHASIVRVPKLLPSYAGLLLTQEIEALTKALSPKHPSIAIIGGAKFNTKEKVLNRLLETYDHVFVGGALANDFLKESGTSVGASLVSNVDTHKVSALLANPKLIIPTDSLVVHQGVATAPNAREQARVTKNADIQPDEVILDHGPETIASLEGLVQKAKSILWNGPLGNYEHGFIDATNSLARAIASSRGHSVVGGGDTIASIENLNLMSHFSFVSTGGGAMLEFLSQGTLPGIEVLNEQ